jgi:hypothetical protein
MDVIKVCYENLITDLKRGQVTGLEEQFLDLKLKNGFITQSSLQKILSEVEQNYQVRLQSSLKLFSSASLE